MVDSNPTAITKFRAVDTYRAVEACLDNSNSIISLDINGWGETNCKGNAIALIVAITNGTYSTIVPNEKFNHQRCK